MILERRGRADGLRALPVLACAGAGIGWRARRRRDRDLQLSVQIEFAEERERQFRNLGAARGIVDIGADAMEHGGDFVLVLDMPEKRRRVGAVAAIAIRSGPAGLRRIGDDRSIRALDLGKPARNAAAPGPPDRALQFVGERIVAAGIQHQDAKVLGLLEIVEHVIHARGAAQIRLVAEHGIDRDQIVDAGILHRVAAVIEYGNVRRARRLCKVDGGIVHFRLVEI